MEPVERLSGRLLVTLGEVNVCPLFCSATDSNGSIAPLRLTVANGSFAPILLKDSASIGADKIAAL